MFPGLVTEVREPLIREVLPSLNAAMVKGEINTPQRIAAFLTTLRFESWILYNQKQLTQTREYYGRGLIQLTGRATDPDASGEVMNYGPCGRYFGIDLIGNPDLALTLAWSAKIAVWYWTVSHHCNEFADNNQMGKVNGAIGYPRLPDGSNDIARCKAYANALMYLTGQTTVDVDCNR